MRQVRIQAEHATGWRQVATQVDVADTMWTRVRGLLGRDYLDPDQGLWIVPCPAIHMFFMKFPIDAVFLDRQLRVVKIYHQIAPWHCTATVRGAYSCLELAAGRAMACELTTGQMLQMEAVSDADHCA